MTAPTPAELDQQIIDAGRALARAQQAPVRDTAAINAARALLLQLRAERYPDG